MTASSRVIPVVRYAATPRSESGFPAYGWGKRSSSSQALPWAPKMPVQVTGTPSLARTARSWSLQLARR